MLCYFSITFGILSGVLAVTQDEMQSIHAYMHDAGNKCMAEFGVTKDELQEVKKTKNYDTIDQCFIACTLKENNIIDAKGMFDKDAGYAIAEKFFNNPDDLKKAKQVGETCSAVNKENVSDGDKGCERAKLLMQCVLENKETLKR